jgi:hypothetical protein
VSEDSLLEQITAAAEECQLTQNSLIAYRRMLDSPGFLDSRWTEEELARAKTSNIRRKLRKNRGSFFT